MENQLCTLAPVDAGAFSLVCKDTRVFTALGVLRAVGRFWASLHRAYFLFLRMPR